MSYAKKTKEKKIISQKDIDNFKAYIDKKYGELPLESRQAILYNSITYVVERDLITLNIPHQETVVKNLVDSIIYEKKDGLLYDSIAEGVTSCSNSDLTVMENQVEFSQSSCDIKEKTSLFSNFKVYHGILLVVLALVLFANFVSSPNAPTDSSNFISEEKTGIPPHVLYRFEKPNKNFPSYFYCRDIDEESLKQYFKNRNSLLGEEPYFTEVILTAQRFNLNPLLLFAIAGHEQAFVPSEHPYSLLIINNPYNVFGSWEIYNTSLRKSSEITARTIYNSLSELPPFIDPFYWLNRRYAQDSNWWRGVRSIFRNLQRIT